MEGSKLEFLKGAKYDVSVVSMSWEIGPNTEADAISQTCCGLTLAQAGRLIRRAINRTSGEIHITDAYSGEGYTIKRG